MDIHAYLQCFESRLSSYSGDDPLDHWDKFVEYVEQKLPAGGSVISVVLERLVQKFLNQQHYANDPRYVNYCIRCASFCSDPVAFYRQLMSRGVGSTSATLFVSWAQQCERRDLDQEAEAVYQMALQNQAQPQEALLHHYRQFQSRRSAPPPDGGVSGQTGEEPAHKPSQDFPTEPSCVNTIITVSRSENVGVTRSTQGVVTVSEYLKEELLCEGGELSFEEVRAERYFREKKDVVDQMLLEEEKNLCTVRSWLEEMVLGERPCGGGGEPPSTLRTVGAAASLNSHFTHGPLSNLVPSDHLTSSCSSGLKVLPAPAPAPGPLQHLLTVVEESQHPLHVLADTSHCLEEAAPSAELPVESVLEQRSSEHQPSAPLQEVEEKHHMSHGGSINLSHVTPNGSLVYIQATPSRVLPSPTVNTREALDTIMDMFQAPTLLEEPFQRTSVFLTAQKEHDGLGPHNPPRSKSFTIFQDQEEDKENCRTSAPAAVDKSRPVRALAEIPASRREKPNETPTDLVPEDSTMWGAGWLAACPNSTSDFAPLAQFVSTPFTNKNPGSSIFYQDQDSCGDSVEIHGGGGGVGENFIRRQSKKLSPILEQSPSEEKQCDSTLGHLLSFPSSGRHGTIIGEGLPPVQHVLTSSSSSMVQTVPPAVLSFREHTLCPAPSSVSGRGWEVYTSPERSPRPGASGSVNDIPMSPDQPMMSSRINAVVEDESMNPEPGAGLVLPLVSDPWDQELLLQLLSSLTPPLSAHPHCVTWQCQLPAISPKMTLRLGPASVHVDWVLGEGAFATVYQATDPVTSERMALKVQKPANPWEFYIHTQLDARLPPQLRPLYSRVSSAHFFHNGSVLLGELHGYGTLLHTVNLFKSQPERVLPQPLVLYFTACILHMVELLHSVQLVHADIKPDNFLLGARFLDHSGLEAETPDPGLVLIDLGQSIDMRLFPEGTAFTARCQTSGFQCTEMLSGKPWNYQTDYFGVAGTIHCLLFGTYMQVTNQDGVWTTNGTFRRNPHSALWQQFFHILLNVPDCGSLPDLRNLRAQVTHVLQQDYSGKLPMLKRRLQVLLLENRRSARR